MLEELQSAVAAAAEGVGPAVVGLGRGWGRGSGVIVAPGQVLTSAHVLRGDEATLTFADGETAHADVAGADADLDVALLTADTAGRPAVRWDPEVVAGVTVGTPVFALANPGGRGPRTTFGLVSSTGRGFRGPRGRRVGGAVEHSAPLPRGSSGGPLVDREGRLLGLNTLRLEGGLILALPAGPELRARVDALAHGEAGARPRLGIALAPARAARRLREAVGLPERDGVLVRGVEADSPAGRAGLERGDLVVGADGREVTDVDHLVDALEAAGEELALRVVRGTEEREVTVALRED